MLDDLRIFEDAVSRLTTPEARLRLLLFTVDDAEVSATLWLDAIVEDFGITLPIPPRRDFLPLVVKGVS